MDMLALWESVVTFMAVPFYVFVMLGIAAGAVHLFRKQLLDL